MARAIRRALQSAGADVLVAWEAGMKSRDDEDHLRLALELGRVIVTSNVEDFARLHHEWVSDGRSHAGMILIEQGRFGIGEVIRRLLLLVAIADPDDMANRTEYLSHWG